MVRRIPPTGRPNLVRDDSLISTFSLTRYIRSSTATSIDPSSAQWLKRNQGTSSYLMSMLDLRRARRLLLLHMSHRRIESDARPESGSRHHRRRIAHRAFNAVLPTSRNIGNKGTTGIATIIFTTPCAVRDPRKMTPPRIQAPYSDIPRR